MIGKAAVFALLVGSLIYTLPAHAGSLIEERLSTIEEVEVEVLVPRYEPIPGWAPDELQLELHKKAVETLAKHGLKVAASARQNLVIMVMYQREKVTTDAAAILVSFELQEPAQLVRKWSETVSPEVTVTSWNDVSFGLGKAKDLRARLFEMIELGLKNFSEKVSQARHLRERDRGCPN